jgi:hypothetical protein
MAWPTSHALDKSIGIAILHLDNLPRALSLASPFQGSTNLLIGERVTKLISRRER